MLTVEQVVNSQKNQIDTLFGLWATVNNLSRLRPSRRDRYRVTVFGSARTQPGHWVYEEVKRMCAALAPWAATSSPVVVRA